MNTTFSSTYKRDQFFQSLKSNTMNNFKKAFYAILFLISISSAFAQTPNTCCPPFTKSEVTSNLSITYKNPSDPNSDYALTYTPSASFKTKMNAYWNYMKLVCPSKKFVIVFEVKELPSYSKASCSSWLIFDPSTSTSPFGPIYFGNPSWCNAAEASFNGTWLKCGKKYAILFNMVSEPGPNCFTSGCLPSTVFYSEKNCIISGIQKTAASKPSSNKVQISDESGVLKTY